MPLIFAILILEFLQVIWEWAVLIDVCIGDSELMRYSLAIIPSMVVSKWIRMPSMWLESENLSHIKLNLRHRTQLKIESVGGRVPVGMATGRLGTGYGNTIPIPVPSPILNLGFSGNPRPCPRQGGASHSRPNPRFLIKCLLFLIKSIVCRVKIISQQGKKGHKTWNNFSKHNKSI